MHLCIKDIPITTFDHSIHPCCHEKLNQALALEDDEQLGSHRTKTKIETAVDEFFSHLKPGKDLPGIWVNIWEGLTRCFNFKEMEFYGSS